jgi:hypothetical protein
MLSLSWSAGLLAFSAIAHPVLGAPQVGEADVVYKNGFVYTVDAVRSRAQAFSVRDGKFLSVGTNNDMKTVTGKDTEVVDLEGQMEMLASAGRSSSGPDRDPWGAGKRMSLWNP